MLHEAINWNFLEFSPSSIFFRTIYSLIVFHLVRGLNLIHLTVFDRARAKNISSAKSSRFRITKCGNGRKKSPDSKGVLHKHERKSQQCAIVHRIWCAPPRSPQLHLTFSISCKNRFAVHFAFKKFKSSSCNFMHFFDSPSGCLFQLLFVS